MKKIIKIKDIATYSKGSQINGDELIDGAEFDYLNGGINPSGKWNKANCAANTITISEGGNSCGYVNFMSKPFWCGAHCYYLYNIVDNSRYLYYALKSQQDRIMKLRSGACMPNIKKNVLGNFEFYFDDDVNVQKRVTLVLNKLESIIELRKHELRQLDDLIKARFIEMFGDVIRNDKEWETATVESLCKEIYGGGTPSKAHPEYYEDGDIPWVSSKDMKTDILMDSQIKINQLGVDNSTARIVPVDSVIMVIRSGILKHTLPVAVNIVPITVNQDLKVFIPGDCVLTRFLAIQFKMLEKDILSGVRAVTADNIEFDSLKKRKMIVPPIDIQQRYVEFIEQVDKSKFIKMNSTI